MKRIACLLAFALTSGSTALASGLAGNALSFDGASATVEIPNSPSLQVSAATTIQLWINPQYSATSKIILWKGDGLNVTSDQSYGLFLGPYNIPMAVGFAFFSGQATGWTQIDALNPVPVGQWTQITGVYDSVHGYASIYINGVLDNTRTTDASGLYPITQPIRASNLPLFLASRNAGALGGGGLNYGGLMDEVRIWNTALSAADIAANYNQLVDPTTPGLVADYNLDESISDQDVYDSTGYGNNGSLGTSVAAGSDDPTRLDSTAPIVPEPASLTLLTLGAVALLARWKRARK